MRQGIFSEHTTSAESAILLPNHLASSLDDTLGDRAEYLNQETGLTVIAFERPGTGSLPSCPPFDIYNYLEDAKARAAALQAVLDERGIGRAIITHDSAGALDSLALAVSGEVGVERVIPIEPVGMINVSSTTSGLARWAKAELTGDKGHNLVEFRHLKPLDAIRPKPSIAEMISRFHSEIRAYRDIYTSDFARDLLRRLASNNVKVNLIFAEYSYTSTPKVQAESQKEFEGSSVKIDILQDAHHACVEPYSHFVHLVQKVLQLAQS